MPYIFRAGPIIVGSSDRNSSWEYLRGMRLRMVSQHCLTPSASAMQDMDETKREAAQVVELLDLRQGGLTQTLDGGFPELRNSVWQSEISVQSAVQV